MVVVRQVVEAQLRPGGVLLLLLVERSKARLVLLMLEGPDVLLLLLQGVLLLLERRLVSVWVAGGGGDMEIGAAASLQLRRDLRSRHAAPRLRAQGVGGGRGGGGGGGRGVGGRRRGHEELEGGRRVAGREELLVPGLEQRLR